jgi:hypothetical protein
MGWVYFPLLRGFPSKKMACQRQNEKPHTATAAHSVTLSTTIIVTATFRKPNRPDNGGSALFPHGDYGVEFDLMVGGGMAERDVIVAATATNATILDIEQKVET